MTFDIYDVNEDGFIDEQDLFTVRSLFLSCISLSIYLSSSLSLAHSFMHPSAARDRSHPLFCTRNLFSPLNLGSQDDDNVLDER